MIVTNGHGDYWTRHKLEKLILYCSAFLEHMSDRPFRPLYIDGCAGTGYVRRHNPKRTLRYGFFKDPPNITDGSARLVLGLDNKFDKYVFVETAKASHRILKRVMEDFPHRQPRIRLRRWDANTFLPKLCGETDWNTWRAVVFVDPTSTQIDWETVKAIAETKGADLWYLFPVGQTVNRLLRQNRNEITDQSRRSLDRMFGATDWYERFYRKRRLPLLKVDEQVKVVNDSQITDYFVERLKSVFAHVERPYRLFNRAGVPLFALCFASPSRKRAELARAVLQERCDILLR